MAARACYIVRNRLCEVGHRGVGGYPGSLRGSPGRRGGVPLRPAARLDHHACRRRPRCRCPLQGPYRAALRRRGRRGCERRGPPQPGGHRDPAGRGTPGAAPADRGAQEEPQTPILVPGTGLVHGRTLSHHRRWRGPRPPYHHPRRRSRWRGRAARARLTRVGRWRVRWLPRRPAAAVGYAQPLGPGPTPIDGEPGDHRGLPYPHAHSHSRGHDGHAARPRHPRASRTHTFPARRGPAAGIARRDLPLPPAGPDLRQPLHRCPGAERRAGALLGVLHRWATGPLPSPPVAAIRVHRDAADPQADPVAVRARPRAVARRGHGPAAGRGYGWSPSGSSTSCAPSRSS